MRTRLARVRISLSPKRTLTSHILGVLYVRGKKSSSKNSPFGDKVKRLYIGISRRQRLHEAYWISEVVLLSDASIGCLTAKFDFLGRLVDFQSLSIL